MYGRAGLDRFKKAQSLEPFSVNSNSSTNAKSSSQHPTKPIHQPLPIYSPHQQPHYQNQHPASQKPLSGQDATAPAQLTTQVGGGQSNWTIEPIPGLYYLDVIKDGEVLDRINLDRRRQIFERQFQTCDFVLDHQSVSRQHAAVVPHKNGSIYVIDLGSAHGTFVANELLVKDSPVEFEVGQSLRFAASTRTYVLRKNNAALFPPPPEPTEINLPPRPDPSDEEAVVAYNTFLNRYGLTRPDTKSKPTQLSSSTSGKDDSQLKGRAAKRIRRMRVAFRDQVGGELVEIVGISDGVDVETEPGPLGVKEGSLVGKYESLVQITVIPKGRDQSSVKEVGVSQTGMTEKLQQVLNKVKAPKSSGIYDDLHGESFSGKLGSSWAYSTLGSSGTQVSPTNDAERKDDSALNEKFGNISASADIENDDDLFG